MTTLNSPEIITSGDFELSIVIPVHNGGEYIKECIHSIFSQTLQQFEILILENASTDHTVEWLTGLNDPRIKIFPSASFLSIEKNWDRIKTIPRKKWICLQGHDDIFKPAFIETIAGLIDQHPGASLYQTHFDYIDAGGKLISHCDAMEELQQLGDYFKRTLKNGGGFVMRSADYDAVGGIPMYPGFFFADFALWMKLTRLSYKATAAENCFSYRHHQKNTSSVSAITRFADGLEAFLNYLYELKTEDKNFQAVLNSDGRNIIALYARSLSHRLLRERVNQRNGLTVKKLVNRLQLHLDRLVDNNAYDISSDRMVQTALFIDRTALTRNLFLFFKKMYKKPLIK